MLPISVDILLFVSKLFYNNVIKKEHRSRAMLLDHISLYANNFVFLKYITDVHAFSMLLPKNVTLKFRSERDASMGKWKFIKPETCHKEVHMPGRLRLTIKNNYKFKPGIYSRNCFSFSNK